MTHAEIWHFAWERGRNILKNWTVINEHFSELLTFFFFSCELFSGCSFCFVLCNFDNFFPSLPRKGIIIWFKATFLNSPPQLISWQFLKPLMWRFSFLYKKIWQGGGKQNFEQMDLGWRNNWKQLRKSIVDRWLYFRCCYTFIMPFCGIAWGQGDIVEFLEMPPVTPGSCIVEGWYRVIENPGKLCCGNDQGHGVCDQDLGDKDVGLVMFWVSSRNCRGRHYGVFWGFFAIYL